ncbi:MAG TPA: gamma-glutamyl-gamma-aminobutyrate hydrolase family protein [Anaeromyxobacteraceae bacterium]|nr:gamma-glutamyl-gamma-aminobutyrate hydrolase family protein [Anaeromyxobacteraceae bacterium]
MSRPRIAVPVGVEPASGRLELPRACAEALQAAGGLPLLVPCLDPALAGEWLAVADGLLVAGGAFDIPPERYGEARRPACGPSRPERTAFEEAIAQAALAAGLPVLGVCGGMQLLAVLRGGTLHQHLPDDLGLSHEQPPPKDVPSHDVAVEPGSLLERVAGPDPLSVNSTHHQAVKEPGRGVRVTGRAPDGVVEAIELDGAPFALGVQWHPEALAGRDPRQRAILRGLVDAARERSR